MSKRGALDCLEKSRGVWLIKVPKYLSQQWTSQAGAPEVGRLKVTPGTSTPILYNSPNVNASSNASQSLASASVVKSGLALGLKELGVMQIGKRGGGPSSTPSQHEFVIMDIKDQSMAVISEDKCMLDPEEVGGKSGKLKLEGRTVKRAECRPPKDEKYMRMKISSIEKDCKPGRAVKMLNEAEVKFKPIAQHTDQIARDKIKKEGKNARLDRDRVMDLIFNAFEKHQFYKLVDLARVTKQPPGYLKEILNDIATYNTQPPHKYLWELKAEYRHYQAGSSAK